MVDPITIIGAAGAIANIIDVASKAVQGLHELHTRWHEADFTLLSLISQLISLQAALSKIEEWITLDDREHHHQFVIGLSSSLLCCKTLVYDMTTVIESLEWDADGRLATSSRIEVVFGKRKRDDYHKAIDAQISVLTLLLSACSWSVLQSREINNILTPAQRNPRRPTKASPEIQEPQGYFDHGAKDSVSACDNA